MNKLEGGDDFSWINQFNFLKDPSRIEGTNENLIEQNGAPLFGPLIWKPASSSDITKQRTQRAMGDYNKWKHFFKHLKQDPKHLIHVIGRAPSPTYRPQPPPAKSSHRFSQPPYHTAPAPTSQPSSVLRNGGVVKTMDSKPGCSGDQRLNHGHQEKHGGEPRANCLVNVPKRPRVLPYRRPICRNLSALATEPPLRVHTRPLRLDRLPSKNEPELSERLPV